MKWEIWLQNLCCKCNGKKIVQFSPHSSWNNLKGQREDPLFEPSVFNLPVSTLLVAHGSAKSRIFHWIPPLWETYCILPQGVLSMLSVNTFREACSQKGVAKRSPLFHEVPNLPRDRESYWVSIRKQESWGSELTYLWQSSKGNKLSCVREVALTQPFVLAGSSYNC